jgi:hypothetical protein
MSFASDVQAKTLTATGTAVNGRSRVQGVYFVNTAAADTITIKNGSTGATVMTIPTPPVAGAHDLLIPNPGKPGLKRPQPEGGARRDSFCARMKGMKKKLTSKKTAKDPNSRINKSLRAWKC